MQLLLNWINILQNKGYYNNKMCNNTNIQLDRCILKLNAMKKIVLNHSFVHMLLTILIKE